VGTPCAETMVSLDTINNNIMQWVLGIVILAGACVCLNSNSSGSLMNCLNSTQMSDHDEIAYTLSSADFRYEVMHSFDY